MISLILFMVEPSPRDENVIGIRAFNLSVMSFPNFVYMTQNTVTFFSILHVFAPLNDVPAQAAYIAWS